ncbi:MAG TPA: Asp-tRNA(Asn)/Glu-tRNA(Gln) amidotransferase subunit GatC [Clostridiaceae bacterium]|nr:Asp-tRNA(Asn)/Glu-tRNA(Gln) amidotransferase subunit GatC [Clostridiaceae bacterium]
MNITENTIELLADLCKIYLSDEEKKDMLTSIQSTVECMDKLSNVDTSNIEPLEHIVTFVNVFREDKVKESMERNIILSNAPQHEDGCYVVPRVVD